MTSTIRGASLAFEADRIEIALDEIVERAGTAGSTVRIQTPNITAPTVTVEDIDADRFGDLALAEILSHARSGRAKVHLPLRPTTMKRGPFSFTIPDNSEVVIDLEVEEDEILRSQTRGSIVPALRLPLGVEVRGVYLDDEGSIIADIAGFPDLNLSWLALDGLQVPASLREVIDRVFDGEDTRLFRPDATVREMNADGGPATAYEGRIVVMREDISPDGVLNQHAEAAGQGERESADKAAGSDAGESDPKASARSSVDAIDVDRVRVEARSVLPHLTPLHLGRIGSLTPGPDSVFDLDFSMEGVTVTGDIELVGGDLDVGGMVVHGLVGHGSFVFRLNGLREVSGISMQFRVERGAIGNAEIRLQDGSFLKVKEAALEDASIDVSWANGLLSWNVSAKNLQADLEGAEVVMRIGTEVTPVRIGPAQLSGSAQAGLDNFAVDLNVEGVDLDIDRISLPLGIAHVDLVRVGANATGRVKAGTDFGYAFTGLLAVAGGVDDGTIEIGPVNARLVDGSEATLEVSQIAASPEGLEAMVARGRLDVRLGTGTLPLGPLGALVFSRGAVGRLDFDEIRILAGETWPHLRGSGNLMARADAMAFESLFQLPSGTAHVDIGGFDLVAGGRLGLGPLRMWVASEAAPEDAASERAEPDASGDGSVEDVSPEKAEPEDAG